MQLDGGVTKADGEAQPEILSIRLGLCPSPSVDPGKSLSLEHSLVGAQRSDQKCSWAWAGTRWRPWARSRRSLWSGLKTGWLAIGVPRW